MNPTYPPEHAAGRAKVRLSRRSSGWWDWYLITLFGEKIEGAEYSGTERTKGEAQRISKDACQDYNAALKLKPVANIPKDRAYRQPVCGN